MLLVASQLAVPAYLEHRAEKRLTAKGGHAQVTIDALPAVRLLFNDGSRIKVRGDGLHVDLLNANGNSQVFGELDRFNQADVRLTRMSAGPFAVRQVTIARHSTSDPYALVISASVTARALSSYAGNELAGPVGGLIGKIASGVHPMALQGGDGNHWSASNPFCERRRRRSRCTKRSSSSSPVPPPTAMKSGSSPPPTTYASSG